jgi:hypothetical protein
VDAMRKNLETGAMFKIQIFKFFKEPNGIMNFNQTLAGIKMQFLQIQSSRHVRYLL